MGKGKLLSTNIFSMIVGARPGLGSQPRYKAPGHLRVKLVENALINIGLVRLSLENGPKLAVGQPNSS